MCRSPGESFEYATVYANACWAGSRGRRREHKSGDQNSEYEGAERILHNVFASWPPKLRITSFEKLPFCSRVGDLKSVFLGVSL